MTHKLKIFLLAIVLCVSATSNAQLLQKLVAAKHNDYGLVYSLPKTHLRIEVEAQQTIKKKGELYNYAKMYLGTDNVILEDSQSWTLKSIKVTSYGIPEKGNEYLIQFKAGATPFIIVDENGLPLAINTEDVTTESYESKEGTPLTTSVLDNNAYLSSLSGEILASGSLSKRAELVAQAIYKIRESRNNYAIGEADQMPADGESMRLVLNELDKREEALMALFLGTTQTATAVKTFDFVPTDSIEKEVVLRISDINGITSKDDLSGEPVYISVTAITKGSMPLDEKGIVKQIPKGAIMYKIPGKAQITIHHDGKEWFNDIFDVAQFGIDYGLAPTLFTDKKKPSYVKFHPATGGIMEIGLLEEALPTEKK